MSTRKPYPREFKIEAVMLVTERTCRARKSRMMSAWMLARSAAGWRSSALTASVPSP